jgi:transposase
LRCDLHGTADRSRLRSAVSLSARPGRLGARRSPARFLREFVDQLELPALGFAMPNAVEGRPPYAPSLLLKIWLDGYFQRIRSTRKLEAACSEHFSLLWLTGLIAPDHNSLWGFWRDNKKALRAVFQQTVQVALHTGAVGLALQALDGTKIEAAASGYSGWSSRREEAPTAERGCPQPQQPRKSERVPIRSSRAPFAHAAGGDTRAPEEVSLLTSAATVGLASSASSIT